MKELVKNIVRSNKGVEAFSYILQNKVLHKWFNFSGDGTFSKDVDSMYHYYEGIGKKYLSAYKGDLPGKTVLEIGSGFSRVALLYLIKQCGLKKAYCYDRFNCMYKNEMEIIEKFGLTPYSERLEYIAGPNDLIAEKIECNSIDYVVSNACLEHVDDLRGLFTLLKRVLRSDGRMFHLVDLRCHNRFKSHGELYFHKFRPTFWNLMGDNIGQPNRMLVDDYEQVFKECGYTMKMAVFEKFLPEEMRKAKQYLRLTDQQVSKYEPSIVGFYLWPQ
jgi:SAM-dependent methyltransferase